MFSPTPTQRESSISSEAFETKKDRARQLEKKKQEKRKEAVIDPTKVKDISLSGNPITKKSNYQYGKWKFGAGKGKGNSGNGKNSFGKGKAGAKKSSKSAR